MSKSRRSPHTVEIFTDAINRHLYDTMTAAGYGTAAATERQLGLYGGFFNQKCRARTLDVGVLLGVLHVLKIDYEPFLQEALAGLSPEKIERAIAAKALPEKAKSPEARRMLDKYGIDRGVRDEGRKTPTTREPAPSVPP